MSMAIPAQCRESGRRFLSAWRYFSSFSTQPPLLRSVFHSLFSVRPVQRVRATSRSNYRKTSSDLKSEHASTIVHVVFLSLSGIVSDTFTAHTSYPTSIPSKSTNLATSLEWDLNRQTGNPLVDNTTSSRYSFDTTKLSVWLWMPNQDMWYASKSNWTCGCMERTC